MSRGATKTCTSGAAAAGSELWGARDAARNHLADLLAARRFSLALFLSGELAATGVIEDGDARFISSTVRLARAKQCRDVEVN